MLHHYYDTPIAVNTEITIVNPYTFFQVEAGITNLPANQFGAGRWCLHINESQEH